MLQVCCLWEAYDFWLPKVLRKKNSLSFATGFSRKQGEDFFDMVHLVQINMKI